MNRIASSSSRSQVISFTFLPLEVGIGFLYPENSRPDMSLWVEISRRDIENGIEL
jgi:hypothetical protein